MKNISIKNLIESQLPSFARDYHPLFVEFMVAYYEWLSQEENQIIPKSSLSNYLEKMTDIDNTLDIFLDEFKKKYLDEFPVNLAINQTTGERLNVRNVIKNIKQFYLARGTEKSYKFLFKVLYNSEVDFYYPKLDMLRLSDGKWKNDIIMRMSTASGKDVFKYIGKEIFLRQIPKESDSPYLFRAKLLNVILKEIGNYSIAELYIENPQGDIDSTNGTLYTEDGIFGNLQKILTGVVIENSGENYAVGDQLQFVDSEEKSVGIAPEVFVSRVINFNNKLGQVVEFNILNPGFAIDNISIAENPIKSVFSEADGFQGSLLKSYISFQKGRYLNNDGKISSNKYIQDSRYYQEFSYVLKTEKTIENLRNSIKKLLHPAGYEFFAQVLLNKCIKGDMLSFLQVLTKQDYRIGNFLPYTFQTFDNLGLWFGESCYYPEIHDPLIITGSESTIGNPIANNIDFVEITGPSCISGNSETEYWTTFSHPNTFLNKDLSNFGVARIHRNQLIDFYGSETAGYGQSVTGWAEWILSNTNQKLGKGKNPEYIQEILDLQREFFNNFETENLNSQNVGLINFESPSTPGASGGGTEFRKIIIGNFLENVGFDYDCRKPTKIPAIDKNQKISKTNRERFPVFSNIEKI